MVVPDKQWIVDVVLDASGCTCETARCGARPAGERENEPQRTVTGSELRGKSVRDRAPSPSPRVRLSNPGYRAVGGDCWRPLQRTEHAPGSRAKKSHSHAPRRRQRPPRPRTLARRARCSAHRRRAEGAGGQGQGSIYTQALEEDTTPLVSSHPPRSPRSRS